MKRRTVGLAVLGLALILATTGADAQSAPDAAKKEGKVVWYSSLGLSVAQKICDAFNKKSLGVTCELNRDGSERIFQKVMLEAGANLSIADVVHTSDMSHFLDFKSKNMLAKHMPAGAEKFRPEFRDKDGFYTVLRGTPVPSTAPAPIRSAKNPDRSRSGPDRRSHDHRNSTNPAATRPPSSAYGSRARLNLQFL